MPDMHTKALAVDRGTAQELRVLAVLPNDLSSVPSAYITWLSTTCNYSPMGSDLFWFSWAPPPQSKSPLVKTERLTGHRHLRKSLLIS